MEMPPKLQNQLAQYEQLRQQLQMITSQKVQLEAKFKEVENTLKELEDLSEDQPIYKNIGAFFIKVKEVDKLKEELDDQKETLSIRVKTVSRQEKQLSERFQSLQTEIQSAMRSIQNVGELDKLT